MHSLQELRKNGKRQGLPMTRIRELTRGLLSALSLLTSEKVRTRLAHPAHSLYYTNTFQFLPWKPPVCSLHTSCARDPSRSSLDAKTVVIRISVSLAFAESYPLRILESRIHQSGASQAGVAILTILPRRCRLCIGISRQTMSC